MVFGSADFFDGLRTFPRDPDDLRHHVGRLNYTLQKRYFVAPELSELALQGKRSEDFERYYRQQVSRVIAHFNAATRSQMRARADPRHPRGVVLQRSAAPRGPRTGGADGLPAPAPSSAAAPFPAPSSAPALSPAPAPWAAAMAETSGRLAQRALWAGAEAQRPLGAEERAGEASEDRSTEAQSTVRKPRREADVMFGTPPEFTGFNVPLEASPGDSQFSKSPLLTLKCSRLESAPLAEVQQTTSVTMPGKEIRLRGGNGVDKMEAFKFATVPSVVRIVDNPTSGISSHVKKEVSPDVTEQSERQPSTVPKQVSKSDSANWSSCSGSLPSQSQGTAVTSQSLLPVSPPVSTASCSQTESPVVRELFHENVVKNSDNRKNENIESKSKGQMKLSDFFKSMACPKKK